MRALPGIPVNTFKDGEGVVHAVRYRIAKARGAWQSYCETYDDVHKGDVYQLHQRPLTCVACAARRHDVG